MQQLRNATFAVLWLVALSNLHLFGLSVQLQDKSTRQTAIFEPSIQIERWAEGRDEQKPAPTTSQADHKIYLLYDDSKLPDRARAQLVFLLAKQPTSDRKIITVTDQDQGITKLIQNNYHLSGITDELSVEALATTIRTLNRLQGDKIIAGQALSAPSLPARAYRIDNIPQPLFRVATTGSETVAIANRVDDLRGNTLSTTSEPRNGQLTAKEVADPRELANAAWQLGSTPILPTGVFPIEDGGDLQIHLAAAAPCALQSWLESSPLYSQLKNWMANFLVQAHNHDLLLSRAKKLPLVVIDWNDDANKHGQKVASVVKYVLSELGVGDLAFYEVDLNPANNSSGLKAIFSDYLKSYYCTLQGIDCKSEGQKALISDVNRWLNSKSKSVNGIASVKQLLLEAVFWKFFSSNSAVVNMSFSVDSVALELLQAQFLAASHSIGLAAASDDPQPEGTAGIPQRAASIYPNFLNVTYGNSDGTILGGFSNDTFNIVVTTIAQGCGFNYDDIGTTDAGTSFATPYVATAVWLKALVTGADMSMARRDVIQASDVSRILNLPQVESFGSFDLATFLLPTAYELVDLQGAVRPISNGTLTIESTKTTGGSINETFTSGEHTDIAFVQDGNSLKVRIRHLRTGSSVFPITDVDERNVSTVTLNVTYASGAAAHYDKSGILSSIAEVRF